MYAIGDGGGSERGRREREGEREKERERRREGQGEREERGSERETYLFHNYIPCLCLVVGYDTVLINDKSVRAASIKTISLICCGSIYRVD